MSTRASTHILTSYDDEELDATYGVLDNLMILLEENDDEDDIESLERVIELLNNNESAVKGRD